MCSEVSHHLRHLQYLDVRDGMSNRNWLITGCDVGVIIAVSFIFAGGKEDMSQP